MPALRVFERAEHAELARASDSGDPRILGQPIILMGRGREVPDRPLADTWETVAAIAVAISSLRLGPLVTPLPRRRSGVVGHVFPTRPALAERAVLGIGLSH